MNTQQRIEAIAYEAFKQNLTPEDLGKMTNAQWEQLVLQAEVSGASIEECDAAVMYLRVLVVAKERR